VFRDTTHVLTFMKLKRGSLYWDVDPNGPRLLRLAPSAAVKEKRLAALLAGREGESERLAAAVRRAQAVGSLALSAIEPAPADVERFEAAQAAVDARAPFSVGALLAWHRAVSGSAAGLRTAERTREHPPPPAPAQFVSTRLQNLEEWLNVGSGVALKPAQQGALALARIVEILPFDDGNGRVARLAASHLMVRAGARPPVLVGEDRPRLIQSLQSAFQLQTAALASLLDEAAERALDVMIRTLEG
jgi:fido (protein-threonine AMPylation protein)